MAYRDECDKNIQAAKSLIEAAFAGREIPEQVKAALEHLTTATDYLLYLPHGASVSQREPE